MKVKNYGLEELLKQLGMTTEQIIADIKREC